MNIRYGNMWSADGDLYLFTGTSSVSIHDPRQIFLPSSSAKEAVKKWPSLPQSLVTYIEGSGEKSDRGTYKVYFPFYLMVSPKWPTSRVGMFQTRDDHKQKPCPIIIAMAAQQLAEWIVEKSVEADRQLVVNMPVPGVEYGGLELSEVQDHLKPIIDIVTFWLPAHARPEADVALPKDHPYAGIMTDDYATFASETLVGFGDGFIACYPSEAWADTANGRLLQLLTVRAYLLPLKPAEDRIKEAFHVGTNSYNYLLKKFGRVR